MAMRRIVQSLGSKTFKSIYAARVPGIHQQGPTQAEPKVGKSTAHAEKDTYIPPQHKDIPHEYQPSHHNMNWESIKDDISSGRPGAQQSQQPWMEKAKETLNQAAEFVKDKTGNLDTATISKTAESLKDGAKEKLTQASEYLTGTADSKDLGAAAKEKLADITEGAKDKLAQAQEFVRKQTLTDSTKKVKDTAKEKYEDLKYTAEQKKKITEEAWDFSKMSKDSDLGNNKVAYGANAEAKTESNLAGDRTGKKFFDQTASSAEEGKGILDSVKETASSAAEWVKDKLTPSGSEKPNLNAATDEKVHAASDKLKSEIKANEEEILKESVSNKTDKNFKDDKVNKNY